MSGYPNLKTDDVELLKIKTKDDQLKELQYKTEKHDIKRLNIVLIQLNGL